MLVDGNVEQAQRGERDMAATPEQRAEFGRQLRTLREAQGWTQPKLGRQLAEHGGYGVSGPAVSDWERGVSAPDQTNTAALERLFGEPAGVLGGLLGYRGDDPAVTTRLERIEEDLAEIKTLILRLDRGIASDAPPTGDGSR